MNPGDKVDWKRQVSQGWGTFRPEAGVVKSENGIYITIYIYNKTEGMIQKRRVKSENVSPRTDHSLLDDKLAQQKEQPA